MLSVGPHHTTVYTFRIARFDTMVGAAAAAAVADDDDDDERRV